MSDLPPPDPRIDQLLHTVRCTACGASANVGDKNHHAIAVTVEIVRFDVLLQKWVPCKCDEDGVRHRIIQCPANCDRGRERKRRPMSTDRSK